MPTKGITRRLSESLRSLAEGQLQTQVSRSGTLDVSALGVVSACAAITAIVLGFHSAHHLWVAALVLLVSSLGLALYALHLPGAEQIGPLIAGMLDARTSNDDAYLEDILLNDLAAETLANERAIGRKDLLLARAVTLSCSRSCSSWPVYHERNGAIHHRPAAHRRAASPAGRRRYGPACSSSPDQIAQSARRGVEPGPARMAARVLPQPLSAQRHTPRALDPPGGWLYSSYLGAAQADGEPVKNRQTRPTQTAGIVTAQITEVGVAEVSVVLTESGIDWGATPPGASRSVTTRHAGACCGLLAGTGGPNRAVVTRFGGL